MSTPQEVLDAIGNLTVMDLCLLTKEMEEKFGVSGERQVQVVQAQEQQVAEAPSQTEFSVILVSYPAEGKVNAIKAVREITGLGLKEAKELTEKAPFPVKEGVDRATAEKFAAMLASAGAKAELK